MDNNTIYVLLMTAMLCLLTIVTRALPFMMARFIKHSEIVGTLGRYLPAYIMLLLVIFELHIPTFFHFPYGSPAIAALCLLVIVQCWYRQMILSIFISTLVYLGLCYGLT